MSRRSLTSKLAQASATVKQVAAFIGPDSLEDITCDFGEYTQPMIGRTRKPLGVRVRHAYRLEGGLIMALKRNEDLKAGDMVNVLGVKRIVRIREYTGPLKDIIFAIADTVPGAGFSLEIGGETEVVA